jgi:SET domain-containing protein
MKFKVPSTLNSNTKFTNYISPKIKIVSHQLEYHKVIALENIVTGEILIREHPVINLFGEEDIDRGLQMVIKFIDAADSNDVLELYPRSREYKKTYYITLIHRIIKECLSSKDLKKVKLAKYLNKYDKETLEYYFAKYIYNAFEGHQYGPLSLPYTAKLNHSCNAPNAVFAFEDVLGGEMVVQASRNIRRGEEIYISYLGNLGYADKLVNIGKNSVEKHKIYLEEHYGFRCDCC